jgi:glycosyltransferase involved in cell wall biosynthesis
LTSTVSVVIPTYNAATFIRRTLESVFAQTRLPDEVIVVDDCSTDDTPAVVEQSARTTKFPVRVIRMEKNCGGPAKPLNVGIEAAVGDLIATLDHDDLMLPERIALQESAFARFKGIALCAGSSVSTHVGSTATATTSSALPEDVPCERTENGLSKVSRVEAHRGVARHGCYVRTCSTIAFLKGAWGQVGGFDESIKTCIDLAFLIRITREFDLATVEAPICRYHFAEDSLFGSAASVLRTHEEILAYSLMDESLLDGRSRRIHRHRLAALYADDAFACRQSGRYRQAAASYVSSFRSRATFPALMGLAKLLPHWLMHRLSNAIAAC